jgi:hypothetical protein
MVTLTVMRVSALTEIAWGPAEAMMVDGQAAAWLDEVDEMSNGVG